MADQTHTLMAIRDEARAQLAALRQIKSSADEVTSRLEALGGFEAVFSGFDWGTVADLTAQQAEDAVQAMAGAEAAVSAYAAKLYPLLRA